jgi:RecJ-like exonuclease
MMSCWKCTACGARVCDLDTCPTCHGQGLKKQVKDEKLKKGLEKIESGTYPSDADHKNFIREDL